MREQDKHFLWSLYAAVAIIFIWKGLWEGLYEIPYLGNPFVFLFIGFAILTFSGIIFKEFDPLGGLGKAVEKTMRAIQRHPQREKFQIRYYDKHCRHPITLSAATLQKVEKGVVVLRHGHKKQEIFIPAHRIREVLYDGKTYWRL